MGRPSAVIQNGPSCQGSPAQEWFHPNGKFGHQWSPLLSAQPKAQHKPILLFPQGISALIRALPKAYEIYNKQVLNQAATEQAANKVIYSVTIASSKLMQVKLEITVSQIRIYIFLKKSRWHEEEGMWRPCGGAILLDHHHDDPDALLQFALSAHEE
jgi:hypothetical protein